MIKSQLIATIGLAATAAWATAVADVDVSKLPPAAKQKGVTYAKDIRPILQNTCFGCHGEQRQKGGLRLDSLDAILKGGKDGEVVVPGKSTKSPLVIAVSRLDEEHAMPPAFKGRGPGGPGGPPGGGPGGARPGGPGGGPGGPPPKPLTPEQVGLIRAWVDQGAK